jgi:hypothetical protein
MTVDYQEMDGSPIEVVNVPKMVGGPGGMFATRRLMCAWEDRWTLAGELWLSQYPYITTLPPCVALSFDIKPLDSGPLQTAYGLADYAQAELSVRYQTAHITGSKLVITETLDRGFQEFPLDSNSFVWADAPTLAVPDGTQPSVKMPHLTYVCTVNNTTSVPAAAISLVGYSNQSAMTAYTFNMSFAPQCLVYAGCRISSAITIGSLTKYAVSYVFYGRGVSWNTFFRSSDATFQGIKLKSTGSVVYPCPPADLTQLFV